MAWVSGSNREKTHNQLYNRKGSLYLDQLSSRRKDAFLPFITKPPAYLLPSHFMLASVIFFNEFSFFVPQDFSY